MTDRQLAERMAEALEGRCILMGDITANEEEVTGILIEIPREQLATMKDSPLYRRVRITIEQPHPCPQCDGEGEMKKGECENCRGTGKL